MTFTEFKNDGAMADSDFVQILDLTEVLPITLPNTSASITLDEEVNINEFNNWLKKYSHIKFRRNLAPVAYVDTTVPSIIRYEVTNGSALCGLDSIILNAGAVTKVSFTIANDLKTFTLSLTTI